MATFDPPRAYVSGDAGLGIVVADGETYVLRAGDAEPRTGTSAQLANLVALSGDLDVYEMPGEPPFADIAGDIVWRTRSSRCVDYIVAVFDPELSAPLRVKAANAAQLLLQETPDLVREMQRVFLSIAPPQNADLQRAASLTRDQPHVHELISRIARNRGRIASLHERWEQESASLPTLAMRAEAAALIRQKALVAELLLGTYDESLVMSADPIIRQAISRWVATVLAVPKSMKLVEPAEIKRTDTPPFEPGDTVKVHVRVKAGNKERIQVFQGLVISRRSRGSRQTFTVRKIAGGIGVERMFLLGSPTIEKVEVERHGRVRRAKLSYLRDLSGKEKRAKNKRSE